MTGEQVRPYEIQLSAREARLSRWVLEGFQRVPDAASDPSRAAVDVLVDRLEEHRESAQLSAAFSLSQEELQVLCTAADSMARVIEAEGMTPPAVGHRTVLFDLAERLKRLLG
jgi:DNA-binding CsgD family transcriptional regulator